MPNDAKLVLKVDAQASHCLVIATHPGIRESHKVNIFRMNLVPITTADFSLSFRESRFSLVWQLPKMFRLIINHDKFNMKMQGLAGSEIYTTLL